MGKLVLGSGGIFYENVEDPILNHIISLVSEERRKRGMRAVFLPTAGHDNPKDGPLFTDYFMRHGFAEVTTLYLTDPTLTKDTIKNTILSADVIYARGGNLQFLMETWRRTHADIYLKQAYENGTVCAGHSSGAMCWCENGYDDCRPDDKYMFIRGIGLIPYIFCPHFEDWPSFLEDVKMQELNAIGCDNDIAVSIVDGVYEIIDTRRNPNHTAYFMSREDQYQPHDLQVENVTIHTPTGFPEYLPKIH